MVTEVNRRLLRHHELERERRLDSLVSRTMRALRPAVSSIDDEDALLAAVVAGEAALAAALVELEELGADQADEEVEAVIDTPSVAAPALVGTLTAGLLTAAVFRALDESKRRTIGLAKPSVLADLRAGIGNAVERVVVTEATRAINTGALAAMRTYDGVEAIWYTETGACPICDDLGGRLIEVETGIPPAHPNCRCSTVPAPVAVASS